jgi:hypothetical protein
MRMAMAAALLSATGVYAEMGTGHGSGSEGTVGEPTPQPPGATKGRSDPGREESRRSGVAGAEPMAPGSGAQGSGTENGPDGRGLTGSEGQGEPEDEVSP